MLAIKKLEKMVVDKQAEVARLEKQLGEARAFLGGLEESLKLVEKHGDSSAEDMLRTGSAAYQAREILREAGKPLHVNEILKKIGRETTKKNRLSLSGSLSSYVRDETIFSRPAPNTFGLLEFANESDDGDQPGNADSTESEEF